MAKSMHPVSEKLLAWYDANARVLPWRAPPGASPPDSYRVWLSEIMLQQTTVAAVKPYFAAFLDRWPDVESLAAAEEADVMAAWAGLGYYARARNLHACARQVAADHDGRFPDNEAALRTLPGVGAYTAAAIAAIAFGEPAAAVDANVERVVARLFVLAAPLPKARDAIRARAAQLLPSERPGDFAQAMMDLGSLICTARDPACAICPLREECAGARTADPGAFPVKPAKKAKPLREGVAWWIERDGFVLLVRRPPRGMLGGMRALPSEGWDKADDSIARAAANTVWIDCGVVSHVFTHFALELSVMAARGLTAPDIDGEWWPVAQIEAAGLPTLFAKAAARAIAALEENS